MKQKKNSLTFDKLVKKEIQMRKFEAFTEQWKNNQRKIHKLSNK